MMFSASDFPNATTIHVKKGTCVIYEGDAAGNTAYLILSGVMEVLTECIDGTQTSLYKLKEGDLFGELALMGVHTRTASVYAIENTALLKINRATWDACIKDYDFLMRVNTMFLQRYLETTKVVRRLGQSSVLHRLGVYLLTLPEWKNNEHDEIDVTLPSQAQLARLLNCTRERVSKIIRELCQTGIIQKHDHGITISKTKLTDTLMDMNTDK